MAPSPSGTGITLALEREYKTTPERVFEAFTTPEKLARWFCPTDDYECIVHELDARVGGKYRFEMKHKGGNVHVAFGTYEVVSRPDRLVFTFAFENNPAAGESRVNVSFEQHGAVTRMHFFQENIPSADIRDRNLNGWTGSFERMTRLF